MSNGYISPNGYQTGPPTVIPNTYPYYAAPNGTLYPQSPSQYVAANPRAAGQLTITIGGTKNTGDVITIIITNPSLYGSPLSLAYTVLSGDTLASIAEGITALINNQSTLQQYDIFATSYKGVITYNHLGPVSLFDTITYTLSVGADATVTISNSGVPAGGSGPAVPLADSVVTINTQTVSLRAGIPVIYTYSVLSYIVNSAQLPIK